MTKGLVTKGGNDRLRNGHRPQSIYCDPRCTFRTSKFTEGGAFKSRTRVFVTLYFPIK